jgi:hypothetical protein
LRRGGTRVSMGDVPRSAILFERRRAERERRAARRAPFVAAVRSAPAGAQGVELALAIDLSESGMRLRRCHGVDADTQPLVRLEFELPDGGPPIVAAGRLLFDHCEGRRAGEGGAFRASGVRFIGLCDEEQARIARFVAMQSAGRGERSRDLARDRETSAA